MGALIQLGPSNIHHLPRMTDRIRPLHDRGALIQLGPSNIHHLPRMTDRIRPLHDRGVGGGIDSVRAFQYNHLPRMADRIRPLHDRGVGGGGGVVTQEAWVFFREQSVSGSI